MKGKKNKEYRWRFALHLGKIGTEFPDLVEHIIPLLSDVLENDKDEKVRAAATEAMSLIRIETSDEETIKKVPIEEIEAQSKDKSELVKDIAKEKLDEIKQVTETEKLIQDVMNGNEVSKQKNVKTKKKAKKTKRSKKKRKKK